MPPTTGTQDSFSCPQLLNEKFKVHSYDGSSYKSKQNYKIQNILELSNERFHCSAHGCKHNLVLKYTGSAEVTFSHIFLGAKLDKCTEPLKSGRAGSFYFYPGKFCRKILWRVGAAGTSVEVGKVTALRISISSSHVINSDVVLVNVLWISTGLFQNIKFRPANFGQYSSML